MMQAHSTSVVSRKHWSAVVLASAVAAVALPSVARAQTRTFVGPGTDYNTAANWSAANVPDTVGEDAVIDAGGAFNVTLSTSGLSVNNFTLGSNDTFGMGNNLNFTIAGTITNNGAFNLNSAGNLTELYVGGANLTGGGTLTFASNSRLRGSGTFTNASTIGGSTSGAGSFGTNELTIVNAAAGIIQANVNGASLFVDPGAGGLSNAGTLRATNSGTLVLSGSGGGAFTNTGTIQAQAGSVVRLETGASVSGGTLSTVGTGEILSTGASIANLTLNGTLRVANNTGLNVSGTIGGTGTILLDSVGNLTDLFVDSVNNATFNIGQTVTLAAVARLRGTGTLTNNGTINGSNTSGGGIGINETTIVNAGVIDANVSGGNLTIDPGAGGLSNTATLRATNGGILALTGSGGGAFTNTGGTITAQTGSTVQVVNSASVTGGTLGSTGTGIVELLGSPTLSALTLGGTVNLVNNNTAFLSGTIVNNSALTLNSSGNLTDLYVNGATIGGTGAITVKSAGRIRGVGTFTNNGTISGESSAGGSVGTNETTIINNGLINANDAGGLTLVVDPAGAAAGVSTFTNNATLRASGGGRLLLSGSGFGEFDNTSGTIEALAGSTVRIENSAVIKGGNVSAVGTGVVEAANATFTNVTFSGAVNQLNNSTVIFSGTNSGAYTVNSTGNLTDLYAGGATIGSAGTVVLKSAARIRGTGTLTNNGVINGESSGGGSIGTNELSIVNNNLISANNPTGLTLVIDPAGAGVGTSTLTNTGSIIATAGGRLLLTGNGGGDFNNAGGTIQAQAGSVVRFESSATIHNGTLTSSGTGVVEVGNGVTLDSVSIGGTVKQLNNTTVALTGSVNLAGNYTVDSSGNLTDLYAAGATVGGTGSLVLKSAARVRGVGTFTNNGTIIGDTNDGGSIGVNELSVVNTGLVNANVNGANLVLDPAATGAFTNTGTAQASNGGILTLTGNGGGNFVNTGGTFQALTGSKIQLINTAAFTGGTLTSSGTGLIELSGNSTVSNATLGGTLSQLNNTTITFGGTITNNGAYTVNSSGNLTDLVVGGVTLNGTGTLTLKSASRLRGAGTFTNNSTVNGETSSGSFGLNETTIVNNKLIDANANGQVLDIDPVTGTSTFTNSATGVTRASGGGILRLNGNGGGDFTNNGTFEALNGSTFTQLNSAVLTNNTAGTLTGGTYRVVATNPAGTATMNLPGGNISTIAANTTVELSGVGSAFSQISTVVNNAGTFKLLDGRNFTTPSAYTNSGVTQLGNSVFTGTGGSTNTSTGEIFGFGTIAGAVSNTGLIRANGGTLQISNAVTGGAGSELRSDSGATLSVAGATADPSTAKLTNNGTLALGARNVTVTSDYTNASFGTGNIFNPRAQVTGTGAINASPAVQQTLTGVTNGTTATPTLALGNIRVGSSLSVPISVNNVGASGPSIRGAIQTTNAAGFGGNITDGRLSGTAMAADFGPIAPGASSSPYTVIFNGSTAGALTGQQLAVVNNFDNVAEQTLSITGAAYNPAVASVTPNPVFVGNFHVGDVVAGSTITFANTAPAGSFSEDLGVGSVAASGTAALGAGSPTSFNVLAGANNTAVKASISTATGGAKSGTLTASLTSTGQVNGVAVPGLSPLPLTGASVAVTGNVYRLANPSVANVNLADRHVGDAAPAGIVIFNNAIGDAYSESVLGTPGTLTGDISSATGTITAPPGGIGTGFIIAQLNTATAGNKSGIVNVGLTSLAVGGTGLSNTPLASQNSTITGKVYNLAAATVNNPQPINFGIVHVGDVVTPIGVSITNSAPAGSFSEKLNATAGPAPTGLTVAGSVSGLAAGSSSSGISVGVNTATAFSTVGAVPFSFVSDGTGIDTLGTTNLAGQNVSVQVQVNNYAKSTLQKTSGAGAFGGGGTAYTLNLGTVNQFTPNPTAVLALLNDAVGPADSLAGGWTVVASNFITSGFNPFAGVVAGSSLTGLTVALDTTTVGSFTGLITLAPRSQNGSGYNGALSNVMLSLSGNVLVPEPTATALLLAGGALLGRRTRRAK